MNTLNFCAYRFVALDDLPALREQLHTLGEALGLKGTILLAPEGINLFLAGSESAVERFGDTLDHDTRLAQLQGKRSWSDAPPFQRLRVRIKREIITMRQSTVRPAGMRAPAVDAPTLQRWLTSGHDDHGRELVLLDTRNHYETEVGRFEGAVDYRLASFGDFPAAVAADRARFEGRTVVSYCTGGIRCEKAALHMQALGIDHVHQLDGGILAYLEHTDGAHWQGDCFVFDQRGAVDARLQPVMDVPARSPDDLSVSEQ